MSVCVVIPAYNEVATIAGVARQARAHADRVVVVDDGSTDGTAAALAGEPVTVLGQRQNCGKGRSLLIGMHDALTHGATAVVTMDADGQHLAADIPRLLAAHRRHPERLIIAARLRERQQMPRLRRFGNAMADFWISWAAGWPIEDSQSGFRLYPAPLLRQLRAVRGSGFVFESEVLIEATRRGFPPQSVAIDAIYHLGARASYFRPLRDTLGIVRMVAGKLVARGLYPQGLWRVLKQRAQHRLIRQPPLPRH
jgi:glycosyltransferase involved in cell wall biosynthesis